MRPAALVHEAGHDVCGHANHDHVLARVADVGAGHEVASCHRVLANLLCHQDAHGLAERVGARPAGVAIALDRQERGLGGLSAAQEVQRDFGIPCIAIASLDDLIEYLSGSGSKAIDTAALYRYREQYGV